MKINFATFTLAMLLPLSVTAQQKDNFYVGDQNKPFTQKEKKFNDWAISAGFGIPLIQSGDLTSIKNGAGKNLFGYSAYLSVDKAITHAFGLNLQYDLGETKQGLAKINEGTVATNVGAKTKYQAISLMGDVNFSNLLRRVDNNSPYRWAFHGYAGLGALSYKAYRQDKGSSSAPMVTDIKLSASSLFGQAGAGVKFKVNRRIDIEGRVMYVVTGDDSFDGGGNYLGSEDVGYKGYDSPVNLREDQVSDNFFNATLGISLKLGKHQSHLMWHDPLQEIYYKLDVLDNKNVDVEVCKKGDVDNDGVCDDWDRQLDTPMGARVDGAGVALDADLDGVIDLNDKCVTVPGPVENNGCPKVVVVDKSALATDIEIALRDVLFNFNKSTIRPESSSKLDLAAQIIKGSQGGTYLLIGHTDKKGSDAYNLALSRARAAEVVKELEKRGVNPSQIKSKGVGESEAKVAESASDEARLQDRKVEVRYVLDSEWNSIPKNDIPTKLIIKK
ncbi:OmpA family protein [Cloacibacterium sp. TD35]|uniref:OmpA family protein n=1 Tax=Cloacibacterium sp. TD35 TaxID=2976818 RepID=UPI00237D6ADA|nr:OmpA family protein [Cloacibacterium sp. TD35]WDT69029.1 OmpA family protein [Cloacibacterium sp. TD35]